MATALSLDVGVEVGEVKYNGFNFPPARKSKIEFFPEYSDDGRTVKYVRAEIMIDFVMVEGMGYDGSLPTMSLTPPTLDDAFVNLRQRLLKSCQPLFFTVQGVGDFAIQTGGYFDVNNGPQPRIVQWRPISNKAAHIVWHVTTCFADCANSSGLLGAAQFPFSVTWNIAENGTLSRNISGALEVPLTRRPQNNRTNASTRLTQSADQYREQVFNRFPPLARFSRTSSFTLTPDRKYLQFNITDTENGSDNPFFPGIVRVSGRRSYSSEWTNGLMQWAGSVSVNVEVAPGYSRLRAWWVFVLIFNDIFGKRELGQRSKSDDTSPSERGAANSGTNSWAYIRSIDIDEELYERSFSFRVGYLLTCSLKTLFQATGLFTPLSISPSDASWNLWRASLAPIQSPRGWLESLRPGTAGGRFLPADDLIVDLCDPAGNALGFPVPDGQPGMEGPGKGADPRDREVVGIKPQDSFVKYDQEVSFIDEEGTVISVPLQKSAPVIEQPRMNKALDQMETDLIPQETESQPKKPTVHRTKPVTYKVVFSGRAVRIGYPISVPNLQSVGGARAIKHGKTTIIPKVLGVAADAATGKPYTVYGLYWKKEYILEKRPLNGNIVSDGHVPMYT